MEIKDGYIKFTEDSVKDIIKDFKKEVKKLNFFYRKSIEKMLSVCKEITIQIEKQDEKLLFIVVVIMPDGSIAYKQNYDLIKTIEAKKMATNEQIEQIKKNIHIFKNGIHDKISINKKMVL